MASQEPTLGEILNYFERIRESDELNSLKLPEPIKRGLTSLTFPQFIRECKKADVSCKDFMKFMALVFENGVLTKEFEITLTAVINNRRTLIPNNVIKEAYLKIGKDFNFIT